MFCIPVRLENIYNHLSDSSNSIYKQLLIEGFNGPFDIVTIPKKLQEDPTNL